MGHVSSAAFSTTLQVPTLVIKLHAMHIPVQAVLQQTPSTQYPPPAHSPTSPTHGLPWAGWALQVVPALAEQ